MKKYNSPEMEIVLYGLEDIIKTSGIDWGTCPYCFSSGSSPTTFSD